MGHLDNKKFRKSYKTFVARKNIRINAKSRGIIELQGKVWYIARLKRVQVLITIKKAKDNLCASNSVSESIEWSQGSKDVGAIRKHMEAVLERVRRDVINRDWPAKTNHLNRCNTTGKDVAKFIEDTCVNCVCWYCTVSQ